MAFEGINQSKNHNVHNCQYITELEGLWQFEKKTKLKRPGTVHSGQHRQTRMQLIYGEKGRSNK